MFGCFPPISFWSHTSWLKLCFNFPLALLLFYEARTLFYVCSETGIHSFQTLHDRIKFWAHFVLRGPGCLHSSAATGAYTGGRAAAATERTVPTASHSTGATVTVFRLFFCSPPPPSIVMCFEYDNFHQNRCIFIKIAIAFVQATPWVLEKFFPKKDRPTNTSVTSKTSVRIGHLLRFSFSCLSIGEGIYSL